MTGRLQRLLRPRSLAFIGGEAAELAIDATRLLDFRGQMFAVNPHRRLRDLPTFATVAELPTVVDAAFVGVGCKATLRIVADLAATGAGAAVCYASGFAEEGDAGAALQRDLVQAASGMPILGPNCYGTISATVGAALWPDVHGLQPCTRGVALVTQSGNVAVNLTMQRRGLDVAHTLALGNQADVGVAEVFETLICDGSVTGVGLFVEAIDDVGRFAAAADAARRRGIPIVALKLGASASSREIAVTHTASMVGSDTAYGALFRRIGVHRVNTLPELLDTLAILTSLGCVAGNRIVSLSCSGGEAALVADRASPRNLDFAAFEPLHRERVAATLDNRVSVNNPLDYHTFIWGDEDRLRDCFGAVLDHGGDPDAGFDAAMLVLDFPADGLDRARWWPTLDAFGWACSTAGTLGVVVASLSENLPMEARRRAAALGLAVCGDIDTALGALEAAVAAGRDAEALGGAGVAAGVAAGRAAEAPAEPVAMLAAARARDPARSAVMGEHAAKQLLATAGIEVPVGRVVEPTEAGDVGADIGYPVVIKATGLNHKSERGGVAVELTCAEEVVAAAHRLGVLGDGRVLVESHIEDGLVELLVAISSAPPVGMLLTLGAGGALVEQIGDTVALLLPTSRDDIREALASLRIWPLLSGLHGGRQKPSVDAVVDAVMALESLVQADRSIVEVEINPIVVTRSSAVAVDALIVVAEPQAASAA